MVASRDLGHRLRNLPVGRKLFAAFSTMALVLLIVLLGLFATVTKLQDANHTVTDRTGARVAASEAIRFRASELGVAQHAYLLDGGASRPAFETATRNFEDALQELRGNVAGPAELALTDKIATGYQTFLQVDQLIWESVQNGATARAKNLALGAENLDFGFITADAESLATIARAQQADAAHSFNATATAARRGAAVLGLVALLLVVFLSVVITRAIRDPLARVQEAAERAAAGDLDAEVGITTADETGRLARAFDSMLGNLRNREQLLRVDHRRQELDGQVHRALEMADDETEAVDVVGRTLSEVVPSKSAELLLADSSRAHLMQAVVSGPDPAGPACSVESPFGCTAVRNGHTMTFESSSNLDACPKLRDRPIGACSAVCVPITFMGRAIGVLHAVGPDRATVPEEEIARLEMLSTQAGARIGMLRSITKTQVQASTDGLTGMFNRRTFETRVRAMHRQGVPFTLVMADLDHFKQLNDTFGHEAGDRALRLFAEVLKGTTRTSDLVARYGGEEFVVALPHAEAIAAVEWSDRVRVTLAGQLATGDTPAFTASFGVAASCCDEQLEGVLKAADVALYRAKAEGRDRVVEYDGAETMPAWSAASSGARPAARTLAGFAALAENDDPLDP